MKPKALFQTLILEKEEKLMHRILKAKVAGPEGGHAPSYHGTVSWSDLHPILMQQRYRGNTSWKLKDAKQILAKDSTHRFK